MKELGEIIKHQSSHISDPGTGLGLFGLYFLLALPKLWDDVKGRGNQRKRGKKSTRLRGIMETV
jgi:hypothetical protein